MPPRKTIPRLEALAMKTLVRRLGQPCIEMTFGFIMILQGQVNQELRKSQTSSSSPQNNHDPKDSNPEEFAEDSCGKENHEECARMPLRNESACGFFSDEEEDFIDVDCDIEIWRRAFENHQNSWKGQRMTYNQKVLGYRVLMEQARIYVNSRLPAALQRRLLEELLEFISVMHIKGCDKVLQSIMKTTIGFFRNEIVTQLNLSSCVHRSQPKRLIVPGYHYPRSMLRGLLGVAGLRSHKKDHTIVLGVPGDLDCFIYDCKNVTYLDVGHFVTPALVWNLGCQCTNLRQLFLDCPDGFFCYEKEGSSVERQNKIYTSGCLAALCGEEYKGFTGKPKGCKKIKTLVLPSPDFRIDEKTKEIKIVAKCLKFMPKLEYLGGVPVIHVVLEYAKLYRAENEPPKPLKLKGFDDFNRQCRIRNPDTLAINTLLGSVNKIIVHTVRPGDTFYFAEFPNVNEITVKTSFERLSSYLLHLRNLKHLDLTGGGENIRPLLTYLHESSPCIEELVLNYFKVEECDRRKTEDKFLQLKTIKLYFPNDLNLSVVVDLVSCCPALTSLHLQIRREACVSHIEDEYMVQLANVAPNLENFFLLQHYKWFKEVTALSVEAFLTSCPRLSRLGKITRWGLTESEVEELQDRVRHNNWDLLLVV
ncbi:uncharacterized protein LOC143039501 [Oratosquilla oratoria]|uniref:uncharacterized protein LOC143039501 n=1 Tax=Oratosquilla oratoria TaxID=337810 RepID=UPI003F775473